MKPDPIDPIEQKLLKIISETPSGSWGGIVKPIAAYIREAIKENYSQSVITEYSKDKSKKAQELVTYAKGWNACRNEMLKNLEGK